MHKPSVALVFLALFTSAEKAEEIEGDLLEQARSNGKPWFIMQVVLTSFALFRQTLLQQPLLVLLPGYAVYELVAKLHLWVIQPLRNYLRYDLDYSGESLLFVSRLGWIVSGYLIGMMLVRYLPKTGMHAAITAAALIMVRVLLLNEVTSPSALLFLVVPILLGGFHTNSRNLYQHDKTTDSVSR